MTEFLAWTGAALSTLMGLSQVVRALRADRLEALSAATYWLTLANAAVWGAWAIVTGQPAAGVPALVNGPAAVLVLTRLGQARQGCATPRRTPTASWTSGPWDGSHFPTNASSGPAAARPWPARGSPAAPSPTGARGR